jgi:sensor histidine kinase YesM
MRLKINPGQSYLFELAKFGGLLVYVFISILALLLNPSYNSDVSIILLTSLSRFISGIISVTIIFQALHFLSARNLVTKKIFYFLVLPVSYIISVVWLVIYACFNSLFLSERFLIDSLYYIKAFSFLYIVIAFVVLYFLINHWISLKKQKEMTLQATNLASEAQLQMLRYQINPHFLFNALNTIRSMVEEDKAVARNMITKLSNFFRYSLSQDGTTDTFENEINAIKSYLEIQKIRFEEKLNVTYDIDESIYQVKIPFFIILPLVENAIKFGLQTSDSPLNIKIIATAGDNLEISVHNSGSLVEYDISNEGTKTGIENTKKRLSLYFPDNHSFRLYEKDSWVIAEIVIYDYKNQLPL